MKTLLNCLALVVSQVLFAQENFMIVGTYDSPKSEGVYVFRFDSKDGTSKEISHLKISNPSFLTPSANGKFVYAVLENGGGGKGGEVAALAFDKGTGSLTLLNKQSSEGDHPCYIEIDKTGKWIFVANYSTGNLAVLPVNIDGSLGKASTVIKYEGSGPDTTRQKSPHAHAAVISKDNKWLFVTDLGTDKIMIYGFDAASGKLAPATEPFVHIPKAGPRHFTFHPNNRFAYLVGELTGVIMAYVYGDGILKPFQMSSTMEMGDKRFPGSADIHVSPDGKYLYASNRGDVNNIAVFSIDEGSGSVIPIGHQPVLGSGPRNFNFDPGGKFLLVGNQKSDEIVVFNRDENSGLLSDSGKRISLGKPVCIKWIPVN